VKMCPKCNVEHDKSGIFCSRSCANKRGPRTVEFKKTVSEKLTGRKVSNDTIQKISGDNHHKRKGKNLSKREIIHCLLCHKQFLQKKDTSKYCSVECYIESYRAVRTEWKQYNIACKFIFNVYNYPKYLDLQLINEHGWYSASNRGNNLNGISRDHMFSVKQGFRQKVCPKIISHPANCQLLLHSLNSSKKTKCSITIEELKERIKNFVSLVE